MKRSNLPIIILLISFCWLGCRQKEESNKIEVKAYPDWEAIATKLMERSNLVTGEKVILMAQPRSFDPLIPLLVEKISNVGAIYLGTFSVDSSAKPAAWETDFVKQAKGKSREDLTNHLMQIDLGMMLPGASPLHMEYAAMQDVLKRNKGRAIHFHWSGAYDLSGEPIEIDSTISEYYQEVFLKTDYDKLGELQRSFEKAIRNEWVTVTTPLGTNIKFKIGNRPVTKQDGDASSKREQQRNLIDREIELPAGAIRVAPEEETVEGTIAFPNSMWNGQKVEGLVLTFRAGKVVDIKATLGVNAVKAELEAAGEAGHSFREFAMGFNPLLAIPQDKPWIPYYGYGAGVVRLSLGDNSELGGNVKGDYVRWNFFTDATVLVGQEAWVKEGRLLRDTINSTTN
jgi:Thermophilic metalloprotease (M29)